MTMKSLLTAALVGALFCLPLSHAAEPAAQDERTRAALKDALTQLRTAQAELAAAQGSAATAAQEKAELAEKFEALKKQYLSEKAATDKAIAGLSNQVTDLKGALVKQTAGLDAARKENDGLRLSLRKTEESLKQISDLLAEAKQRLADRERKNLALFMVGNEILTRYEEFSLGEALRAKEPFVGKTRARLESLLQDYKDKLQDQRVKP